MNVAFLLKKTPIVFLLLLCFVISFNYAEAGRSIRVRKVKSLVSPRHISLSVRSGNGVYARGYGYGRPLPSYSTKGKIGRNRRYYSVRNAAGRRRSLSRNYASRYRNWTPNVNHHGMRNNPRIDKINNQKRRIPFPFLKEPSPKQKRRARPNRFSAMQKPRPPKMPNEFDEDYFFPEEAKRAETKYEFETRYPRPKKKRKPEAEDSFKKPDFPKIPFYDEKPIPYKTKTRNPPFSYSSFVQHPASGPLDDSEDAYEDPDSFYQQPFNRNKKKRVKKKPNSRKKNKDKFKPIVFETDQTDDTFPPYASQDQYELPSKTYKKRNKPNYEPNNDDFVPGSLYSKPKPQVNTLFSTDSDHRGSQNTPQAAQFNPTYSQTWSNVVETTARPIQYQTENGFQPQTYIPNQYNKDYSSLQKVKTVTTNTQQPTYYTQPDNSYKTYNNYNYVNTKVSSTQSQTPNNYNTYYQQSQPTYSQPSQPTYSQPSQPTYSQPSQPTYSQPIPSSSSTLTDVTIQKSVPVYDNTETFYNFNNNAYVNSQSSKYFSSDNASKYYDKDNGYGTRLSATSYRNKLGQEKTEPDSEFIKKHQNLYNNGLAGIPIQGDGYAKESAKKDYDIGYGDFQFDENPST